MNRFNDWIDSWKVNKNTKYDCEVSESLQSGKRIKFSPVETITRSHSLDEKLRIYWSWWKFTCKIMTKITCHKYCALRNQKYLKFLRRSPCFLETKINEMLMKSWKDSKSFHTSKKNDVKSLQTEAKFRNDLKKIFFGTNIIFSII